MTDQANRNAANHVRRALSASAVFYVLIAFEFFYMASPFAAYLYAVYGPGLDWLESSAATRWSVLFFLPHIVAETRSVLVDVAETVGFVLFAGGLCGFVFGALQIYRAKLRRADAVTGGLYRYIRHPQYLALIVASIGMTLVWPRYLVLVLTVTVIFIYIALAKAEEGICLRQYPGYADYMTRTGMVLPFPLPASPWRSERLPTRIANWALAYALALGIAVIGALALHAHALNSLYVWRDGGDVYLSVAAISDEDLRRVAELARSAPATAGATDVRGPLLAYVVPTGMYISEVPMQVPEGARFGHDVPEDVDPARYKVIFTEAIVDGARADADWLRHTVNKTPLVEVHVDLGTDAVTATYAPPEKPFYGTRQVPVF